MYAHCNTEVGQSWPADSMSGDSPNLFRAWAAGRKILNINKHSNTEGALERWLTKSFNRMVRLLSLASPHETICILKHISQEIKCSEALMIRELGDWQQRVSPSRAFYSKHQRHNQTQIRPLKLIQSKRQNMTVQLICLLKSRLLKDTAVQW